jgi:hypothetical protein
MSETAFAKVEDAFADLLRASSDLSGTLIVTEQSADQAVDEDGYAQTITIYTVALNHDNAPEHGQTLHTADLDFEVTSRIPGAGLGRANLLTIARIVAALSGDRELGGRIEDWQEIDTATPNATGKDVAGASLRIRATFYTSRTDWTVLVGQGGTLF